MRKFIKTSTAFLWNSSPSRELLNGKCCFVMTTDGVLASKVRVLKREILSSEVLKWKMNTLYYYQCEYVNYSFELWSRCSIFLIFSNRKFDLQYWPWKWHTERSQWTLEFSQVIIGRVKDTNLASPRGILIAQCVFFATSEGDQDANAWRNWWYPYTSSIPSFKNYLLSSPGRHH